MRSNSPTRDQTWAPTLEAQGLSHWTTREVPRKHLFILYHVLINGIYSHRASKCCLTDKQPTKTTGRRVLKRRRILEDMSRQHAHTCVFKYCNMNGHVRHVWGMATSFLPKTNWMGNPPFAQRGSWKAWDQSWLGSSASLCGLGPVISSTGPWPSQP